MNKMEIGSKLSKLRKNSKMTPIEVANNLKVSESKLLAWEDGKKIPSLYYIKRLSVLYNVKIDNIIDGDILFDKYRKQSRISFFNTLLIIILIIGIFLSLLFFNSKKTSNLEIYSFNGESDNFLFKDGLFIISDDNKYIELSHFEVKNNLDVKSMSINIAFNESIWKVQDYKINQKESLHKWLNKLKFTEQTKMEEHKSKGKKKKTSSFKNYNWNVFPDDFKVEINYCTKDLCTIELLDITANRL